MILMEFLARWMVKRAKLQMEIEIRTSLYQFIPRPLYPITNPATLPSTQKLQMDKSSAHLRTVLLPQAYPRLLQSGQSLPRDPDRLTVQTTATVHPQGGHTTELVSQKPTLILIA